jgi:hypothetical protein
LAAGSIFGLMKDRVKALTVTSAVIVLAYIVLIIGMIFNYGSINPVSRFCAYINKNAGPSDIVCQYKGTDAHFMIYYSKNEVQFIRKSGEVRKLLLGKKKVFCVCESAKAYDDLKKSLANRISKIDESANFTLFTN